MDVLEAIHTRRSIRKYTEQPVDDAAVRTLLEAAMAAPSAGNAQPWQFVVVRDRDLLARVSQLHPYIRMAERAPVGVLVCGDTRLEKHKGYWVVDCAAAAQNLLLAAHALGLGAVWTGIHPMLERQEAFAALFGCPQGVIPHSFIPVGHPAEQKDHDPRFKPERVHAERFSG